MKKKPKLRFFLPCTDVNFDDEERRMDAKGVYEYIQVSNLPSVFALHIVLGIHNLEFGRRYQGLVEVFQAGKRIGGWEKQEISVDKPHEIVVLRLTADNFTVLLDAPVEFRVFIDDVLVDEQFIDIVKE